MRRKHEGVVLDKRAYHCVLVAVWVVLSACDDAAPAPREQSRQLQAASAREIVLAPHAGDHALDEQIRRLQQRVSTSRAQAADLERLGWTFISRARELNDPGSYNMALQCAQAIEDGEPGNRGALLLRGHALHSLHHFVAAEQVARRLVQERALSFDFGLLGDVLVDRGALDEAVESYQRMMDIRPDTHAYARAAHVRYLKGDLNGALLAMQTAARSASPRNKGTFAWTWAKLASYQLQSGDAELALNSAQRALEVSPDSFHALRIQGLVWLSQAEPRRAAQALQAAAERTPHPEVLWMLSEALDQSGRPSEAATARERLLASGASEDPRAFALYLATRGQQLSAAEELVRAELAERKDVYSYEALAWVQAARGELGTALENARRSLAAGSDDPRLYYHAALIAERAGAGADAQAWLEHASRAPQMLLPSQRSALNERRAAGVPARRLDPTHRKGHDDT